MFTWFLTMFVQKSKNCKKNFPPEAGKSKERIQPNIIEKAKNSKPKDPVGVLGNGPIAFGAGAVLTKEWIKEVQEVDSIQFVETK